MNYSSLSHCDFVSHQVIFSHWMTKEQASQLGAALISWSKGASLEARDAMGTDMTWYPFTPQDYEKLSVEEGIEWRTIDRSLLPNS